MALPLTPTPDPTPNPNPNPYFYPYPYPPTQVMARVFMQRCPEGQCTYERDHYEPKKVKESAQTTLWYATAKRPYITLPLPLAPHPNP